jgi:hypothetical protein
MWKEGVLKANAGEQIRMVSLSVSFVGTFIQLALAPASASLMPLGSTVKICGSYDDSSWWLSQRRVITMVMISAFGLELLWKIVIKAALARNGNTYFLLSMQRTLNIPRDSAILPRSMVWAPLLLSVLGLCLQWPSLHAREWNCATYDPTAHLPAELNQTETPNPSLSFVVLVLIVVAAISAERYYHGWSTTELALPHIGARPADLNERSDPIPRDLAGDMKAAAPRPKKPQEIQHTDVEYNAKDEIGRVAFKTVYRGLWKDKEVAISHISHQTASPQVLENFRKELRLM